MLKEFFKQIERRLPIDTVLSRFPDLFQKDAAGQVKFSETGFSALTAFLEKGEASYQSIAVQAAIRWSISSQKVLLRNIIQKRGFLTPSCLWAYIQMRGNPEDIFQGFSDPEMSFMQIVMLKEIDPTASVSFLAEKFLSRKDLPEELKAASRLCMLRLLDVGLDPGLIQTLKCRYPGLEILNQWRPTLPGKKAISMRPAGCSAIDFHQLVRSIHDMKETLFTDAHSLPCVLFLHPID